MIRASLFDKAACDVASMGVLQSGRGRVKIFEEQDF